MARKLPLMAGLFVMAAVMTPHVTAAGPITPMTAAAAGALDGSLVQQAQYGGYRRYYDDDNSYPRYRRYPDYRRHNDYRRYDYRRYHYDHRDGYDRRCRYWRRECADRWGWGGWEFRRCLYRHGCGGGYGH